MHLCVHLGSARNGEVSEVQMQYFGHTASVGGENVFGVSLTPEETRDLFMKKLELKCILEV